MLSNNDTPEMKVLTATKILTLAAVSIVSMCIYPSFAAAQAPKAGSQQVKDDVRRPESKRFEELTKADFERHPVWKVRPPETTSDCIEPWPGKLPINPGSGVYYVKAKFSLNNGTKYDGVISPRRRSDLTGSDIDVRTLSPFMWLKDGSRFYFWIYTLAAKQQLSSQEMRAKLQRKGASTKDVFPVRATAEYGLSKGKKSYKLKGVYFLDAKGTVEHSPY